jgi:DNA-binding helix-hairpin-helix protein with protein kinase domain
MSEHKTVVDTNGVRYELGELLGRGGQGAVYAVAGSQLAVKLVAGLGQARRERMRIQLSHVRRLPVRELSLARPLELLRAPHTGYVMELVTGMTPIKTLWCPPKGEAPSAEWYLETGGLRRRLLVLGRAAHVLSQLHGKGLSYSDPSPANIFISKEAGFTEVCFIDTDNLCYESAPSAVAGVYTPGYGAPELVRGGSGVTTLTDVHAFAVIAFQALTLAHPLIGDLVNDGDPELEEQALAGRLPWIDDEDDDRNRASFGIPREWVLSRRLRDGFKKTFGPGLKSPTARVGAAAWAETLFGAADATIRCKDCGGAFYFTQEACTWCDAVRPTFAAAVFHIWDPGNTPQPGILTKPAEGSARPVVVGHSAVSTDDSLTVTRRLAFGDLGRRSEEPVVEARLSSQRMTVTSVDGASYELHSPTGKRETMVSSNPQVIALKPGQASWRLHFGTKDQRHRTLSFELRLGGPG